ncbi:TonB-dependent receptor [Bacillus sp. NP157]|nr:TonB-dependent receptor [Bacillus sp. NP157]
MHIAVRVGTVIGLAVVAAKAAAIEATPSTPSTGSTTLPTVTVVAVAPGIFEAKDMAGVPYDARSLDRHALDPARSTGLADALEKGIPGVTLNAVQGNPWQPDLQYRGFTASPLLGTPQGLAIYQDGVRVNEVFGDTMNWDLIPARAIDTAAIGAGDAPLFGQNALGGAIALRTRTGFSAPGTRIGYETGSFGRDTSFVESGGNDGRLGYYVLADRLYEKGWRDESPSHARHEVGVFSFRGARLDLDLHLAHADTDLTGNGASPVQLLDERRKAIFTAPDETQNRLAQASLDGSFRFSDDMSLDGTVYSRNVRTRSYNGDTSEYEACDADASILCEDDSDDPVRDEQGHPVSSGYDAIGNVGVRRQRARGANLVFRATQPLLGQDNLFLAGVEVRRGDVGYVASQLLGTLDERRYVEADGPQVVDGDVDAVTRTTDRGLFVSDSLHIGTAWVLDVAGRFNHTRVRIADRSGENPDLDGNHAYSRFNPSVGLAWTPRDGLSAYAGYSESTRAPTPVELTCADEDAPCKLPNDFVSDPPLKQVVARSVEAGLRGAGDGWRWDAGVFRSTSAHDIVFQTTGGSLSNEGFFANVGDTRREGAQASLAGTLGAFDWHASWQYLRARFLSPFDEVSANHPDADDDGVVHVRRGDSIPGLPRQTLKAGIDWRATDAVRIGVDGRYAGGQYLRGDEINALGRTGGYAVFGMDAAWQVNAHVTVSARVDNLFDRRYATVGVLGDPSGVFAGMDDPRFLGPGAPRAGWLSLTLQL